jgi:formate hydrogenlyase subunit 6/NADH:ubiquinone oxidoreductase subunit I
MNIWHVMSNNLKLGPGTLRFPECVPPPANFRGAVQFEPERCVGCATCAYVCTSSAIEVIDRVTDYEWAYDPGRCTFCGRCVAVCPSHALKMAAERPPVYTEAGALQQRQRLAYPRCPECGQPAQPVNDAVLDRAFAEITDEVRSWSRLCVRCRQRCYQPALIETGYAARSKQDER